MNPTQPNRPGPPGTPIPWSPTYHPSPFSPRQIRGFDTPPPQQQPFMAQQMMGQQFQRPQMPGWAGYLQWLRGIQQPPVGGQGIPGSRLGVTLGGPRG